MTSIKTFVSTYTEKVLSQEFHKSMRKGNTGVGYTLESLLGIKENNSTSSDWGEYEIKSMRDDATSPLTLFTKSPQLHPDFKTLKKSTANRELLLGYGYLRDNRNKLQVSLNAQTITNIPGNKKLSISLSNSSIYINDESQRPIAFWHIETLFNCLKKKYSTGQALMVFAESKVIDSEEHFRFHKVILLRGLNPERFIQAVISGDISIELRISTKITGKVHDHGTAFRIRMNKIHNLFESEEIVSNPWSSP